MNTKDILDAIGAASGMDSLSKVTIVHGYRDGVGKVVIELHDRGEADPLRYSVHAYTLDLPERRTTNSNAEADLDTAIATTHWDALMPRRALFG